MFDDVQHRKLGTGAHADGLGARWEHLIAIWTEIEDNLKHMSKLWKKSKIKNDKMLSYIIEHKKRYDGVAPTLREIANQFSPPVSTSNVVYHLNILEKRGLIRTRGKGSSRSRWIEVIGGEWSFNNRSPDVGKNTS